MGGYLIERLVGIHIIYIALVLVVRSFFIGGVLGGRNGIAGRRLEPIGIEKLILGFLV